MQIRKKCNCWKPCTIHKYRDGIILLLVIVIITVIIITIKYFYAIFTIINHVVDWNCKDLAVYVADMSKRYSYAEHRYEWLCVNEQVKEFKG